MKEEPQISFNTADFIADLQMKLAQRIFMAATALQTELKGKLSTPYPPASTPGEYPHARTFEGRNDVAVYPSDLSIIAKTLSTEVGYRVNAYYMSILEQRRQRLGLYHTYQQMKPELARILGGGGYITPGM